MRHGCAPTLGIRADASRSSQARRVRPTGTNGPNWKRHTDRRPFTPKPGKTHPARGENTPAKTSGAPLNSAHGAGIEPELPAGPRFGRRLDGKPRGTRPEDRTWRKPASVRSRPPPFTFRNVPISRTPYARRTGINPHPAADKTAGGTCDETGSRARTRGFRVALAHAATPPPGGGCRPIMPFADSD